MLFTSQGKVMKIACSETSVHFEPDYLAFNPRIQYLRSHWCEGDHHISHESVSKLKDIPETYEGYPEPYVFLTHAQRVLLNKWLLLKSFWQVHIQAQVVLPQICTPFEPSKMTSVGKGSERITSLPTKWRSGCKNKIRRVQTRVLYVLVSRWRKAVWGR